MGCKKHLERIRKLQEEVKLLRAQVAELQALQPKVELIDQEGAADDAG